MSGTVSKSGTDAVHINTDLPKDPEMLRCEIARLDRDAALLRNRSQMTPKDTHTIDKLAAQSAALSASLAQTDVRNELDQAIEKEKAQFMRGTALYCAHQAPALSHSPQILKRFDRVHGPAALGANYIGANCRP